MDEVTNNQQYIDGYFFGRYLACGYVSGSLVCLPVPVQDTTCRQRLEAFIKPSMRKVTTFCGVCIDSMELANHLRSDWGMSFTDKRVSSGNTDPEFLRALLVGFLSHTSEPLLHQLSTRLSLEMT